jgi:hypothetical protein
MISTNLPAPTVAEALRMRLIVEGGCICCWEYAELGVPCEVHHLTIGGHHGAPRRGHAFTVGLCVWHHRGNAPLPQAFGIHVSPTAAYLHELVGPSYARLPGTFRDTFGGDDALLRLQSLRLARVAGSYLIHPGRYADPHRPGGFAP